MHHCEPSLPRAATPSRLMLVALLGACATQTSAETLRVSKSSSGAQANDRAWHAQVSADGRIVAFLASATNLTPPGDPDTNGSADVFIHDRATRTVVRVSKTTDGRETVPGADRVLPNSRIGLSGDGSVVVFRSFSTSLGGPADIDTNDAADIFVHDRNTGVTSRINKSSAGLQADGVSYEATISTDGRVAAFASWANNLSDVVDDSTVSDVFVHERLTRRTIRISRAADGGATDGDSRDPTLSGDGRFVTFTSSATNLTHEGGSPAHTRIYAHDRVAGTTRLVSKRIAGVAPLAHSRDSTISSDGQSIAFVSHANLTDEGDPYLPTGQVYVHDRAGDRIIRVSKTSAGADMRGYFESLALSADGRFVAFQLTHASDCSIHPPPMPVRPCDPAGIYVHDRRTSTTTLIESTGRGASLSGDGRIVAFTSSAALTGAADPDTNAVADAFVRLREGGSVRDRFERNDDASAAQMLSSSLWRLEADLCVPWPFPMPPFPDPADRCPGVFEDYGVRPWSAADRWSLGVQDLSIDSSTDRDFFRVSLPDPSRYPQTADVRPEAERMRWPTSPVPEPECAVLRRIDLTGHPINVTTYGKLEVAITPRANAVADFAVEPLGEGVRLYRGTTYDKHLGVGPALHKTVYCPKDFESLSELVLSFGERSGPRARHALGGYALQLTYTIEAHRGVPDWVTTMAAGRGMRTIVDLPCVASAGSRHGTVFPGCAPNAGERIQLTATHPLAPRWPKCIADGPDCFEPILVAWPSTQAPFAMTLTADARFSFRLLDAQQKVVATAVRIANASAPAGQAQFQLHAPGLSAGLYVLFVRGPPSTYAVEHLALPTP